MSSRYVWPLPICATSWQGTDEGAITLNGRTVEGRPYVRETWKSSIGGDRSSCVIALSETFIQIPDGSSP